LQNQFGFSKPEIFPSFLQNPKNQPHFSKPAKKAAFFRIRKNSQISRKRKKAMPFENYFSRRKEKKTVDKVSEIAVK